MAKFEENRHIGIVGLDGQTQADVTSANRLKIDAEISAIISSRLSDILKVDEEKFSTTTETDMTGTSYTVTAGKTFYLSGIIVNQSQGALTKIRLRVNNILKFRINTNTAGNPHNSIIFTAPVAIASGGQIIKLTAQPTQAANAEVYAAYWGFEV